MPVIVHITSGPNQGQEKTLKAGEKLRIGRGDENDFSFPDDERMSRNHFVIKVEATRCRIEDLNSSNGTYVNDDRIERPCLLEDGARVRAGQTHFVVKIVGQTIHRSYPALRPGGSSRSIPTVEIPKFMAEACPSGLTCYRASHSLSESTPLRLIVGRLFQHGTPYLILDPTKLEPGTAPAALQSTPLFDWLPPEARQISPIIIPPGALEGDPIDVLDVAWDRNALLCIFVAPNVSVDIMLRHFQAMTKWSGDGSGSGEQGMLGWCWPAVLSPLLASREPKFVERLLQGVTAVLMEVPGQPRQWQVYGGAEFREVLLAADFLPGTAPA